MSGLCYGESRSLLYNVDFSVLVSMSISRAIVGVQPLPTPMVARWLRDDEHPNVRSLSPVTVRM